MPPGHDGVAPNHSPCGYCRAESLVRDIALGDDQKTGCLLVQAMDQPRPVRPAPLGELAPAAHQRVYESSSPVAGSRVNDHSGSLVDHQEVGVLVHYPERDILALDVAPGRGRSRCRDLDQIVGGGAIGGTLPTPVDRYVA